MLQTLFAQSAKQLDYHCNTFTENDSTDLEKYPRIWNGDEDTWPNLLSSRLLAYYQYQIAALSKLRRIFSNFHKKEENAELDNLGRCKHNLLMHIWPGNSLYLYLCLYLHLFAGYTFS